VLAAATTILEPKSPTQCPPQVLKTSGIWGCQPSMQASFQVPVGENCVVHPEFPEFKDQCLDFFALIKKKTQNPFPSLQIIGFVQMRFLFPSKTRIEQIGNFHVRTTRPWQFKLETENLGCKA
jgi:hypothetical protein